MFPIFNIKSEAQFKSVALSIFRHQFEKNPVYRSFCDLLYVHPSEITELDQVPFLPIEFFKSAKIVSSQSAAQQVFLSSGTSGSLVSQHFVTDISVYRRSYLETFQHFYGSIEDYAILALLPSYLEREGSSLVFMVDDLIKRTKHPESGFFLKNHVDLTKKLTFLDKKEQKVLLIGVSFALLDLLENNKFDLNHTIVMETGGMKGNRKELIRDELHAILKSGFGVSQIHSEYGMTELLSQAYAIKNGVFRCPPWMRALTRDTEDPLHILTDNSTGGLNIIDLANYNSCSFIATGDLGKVYPDGAFEVLGRFDHSDIRGCNLMID